MDGDLKYIEFLFESYKPEFWYVRERGEHMSLMSEKRERSEHVSLASSTFTLYSTHARLVPLTLASLTCTHSLNLYSPCTYSLSPCSSPFNPRSPLIYSHSHSLRSQVLGDY